MSMSLRGSHETVDGSLVSAGSGPAPVNWLWPGPGACGLLTSFRTGAGQWQGWVRRSGRCMLAAGVAVAVALGPASGARTDGVTAAVMAEHGYALKTTALIRLSGMGVGRARCVAVPGVRWSNPSGMDPFHRGFDHLGQQLARARQVAVARRGGAWQAAGLSGREPSVSGRTRIWAPGVRHARGKPDIACRTMPSLAGGCPGSVVRAAHAACPPGHPHAGLHGMGAWRTGRVPARWLHGRRDWQTCASAV